MDTISKFAVQWIDNPSNRRKKDRKADKYSAISILFYGSLLTFSISFFTFVFFCIKAMINRDVGIII